MNNNVLSTKYIAFTFDDGPNNIMNDFVDKFNACGRKATFMLVGDKIEGNEDIVKYAHNSSHELASNSFNHINLTKLAVVEEIKQQLSAVETQIRKFIPDYTVKSCRLPYLAQNELTNRACAELGYGNLGTEVDTNDWDYENVTIEDIIDRVLNENSKICDGTIVVLHVIENTLIALDTILPELQKRGYKFVTVSELYELNGKQIPLGKMLGNVND